MPAVDASGGGGADALLEAFARLVLLRPEHAIAVSPTRSWTIERLAGEVDALSRRAGVDDLVPGEPVGLAAVNGPSFLAALLAMRRRRAVIVLIDASLPTRERLATCARLGARRLLALDDAWRAVPRVEAVEGARRERPPDGTAFLRTTSGTSGAPRGIALTSDALLADDAAITASLGLRASDRVVACVPMSHAYGTSTVVVPALVRGATVVVADDAAPLAPLVAARACEATALPTVPAWIASFLKLDAPWPPTLAHVISAGAPLPPAVARAFRERTGRAIHVLYGASECGAICCDSMGGAAERGTVGAPARGVDVALEGDGEAGRVVVRSAACATCYWPDGDSSLGGGEYRSADGGAWMDGELRLLGREDVVINVRGRKVQPAEVERVLLEMPGCDDVAVVALPTGTGEGDRIRAVIACDPARVTASDVLSWCNGRLAAHKMPRSIVLLEALPRNARGKVELAALRALEAEP